MEDTRRAYPPNQLNRAHLASESLKKQERGLHGPALNPLLICYGCYLGILMRLLPAGSRCVSELFFCS